MDQRPSDKNSLPPDPGPASIPDHELLKCIGEGSYGTVWMARSSMGMYRAVKLVYRNSFSDQKPYDRELSGIRKFEPVSRSHEGFIDVLQVGINDQDGYFYYVMELGDDQVSGQEFNPQSYSPKTLSWVIAQRRKLSHRDCLELGLGLSQALAELHKRGLVHRDVKPSNIIFVNGVPKLADIGLVAEANEAKSYVGTEGFIPPEGPGRPQADVYGLGKVLYEASTGRDRKDFPALPTLLGKTPDEAAFLELNEVILHACNNDVNRRYQSAWEMYGDLLVLANGKSVRRLKILERRFSNLKRIAGAVVGVAVVLGAIAFQVDRQREAVNEAHRRQDVSFANHAVDSLDYFAALPYIADALQIPGGSATEVDANRIRFATTLSHCPKLTHFWAEPREVVNGVFSPDGTKIAIVLDFTEARIYDIKSGQMFLQPFAQEQGLSSVAFSHDGRYLVTGSQSGRVRVWDATTLKEVLHFTHKGRVFNVRFSPDGNRIVTACEDGFARVWNLQTGKLLFSLKHAKSIRFADFSQDGRLIVTCSEDHAACIWDATTGAPVGKPLQHRNWVYYASFSPDGHRLVTASADHRALVWDVDTSRPVSPDLIHTDAVKSAEFSPDGQLILTASLDGTVRFFRADDFQPADFLPVLNHGARVMRATFDSEGRCVLSTCADGSVRIWDLAGVQLPTQCEQSSFSSYGKFCFKAKGNQVDVVNLTNGETNRQIPTADLISVRVGRMGRFVVVISAPKDSAGKIGRLVQVWNTAEEKFVAPPIPLDVPFTDASVSDDGKRLMVFGNKQAQFFDIESRAPLAAPIFQNEVVTAAFLSPNGAEAAFVSRRDVRIWDVVKNQLAFPALTNAQPVSHAEFSLDGTQLVCCGADSTFNRGYAQVYDARSGEPISPRLFHHDGVLFATLSPDGKLVATAGEDFRGMIWETGTGRLIAILNHGEKVNSIVFSPDGQWVVTGSADQSARVWDARTGMAITPPLWHIEPVVIAQFVAGGKQVATTDKKGRQYLWDLAADKRPTAEMLKLAGFLSGATTDVANEPQLARSRSLDPMEKELETKCPADFFISSKQVEEWHELEAEYGEHNRMWPAAAFHLKWLLNHETTDPSLAGRLAQVNSHLNP